MTNHKATLRPHNKRGRMRHPTMSRPSSCSRLLLRCQHHTRHSRDPNSNSTPCKSPRDMESKEESHITYAISLDRARIAVARHLPSTSPMAFNLFLGLRLHRLAADLIPSSRPCHQCLQTTPHSIRISRAASRCGKRLLTYALNTDSRLARSVLSSIQWHRRRDSRRNTSKTSHTRKAILTSTCLIMLRIIHHTWVISNNYRQNTCLRYSPLALPCRCRASPCPRRFNLSRTLNPVRSYLRLCLTGLMRIANLLHRLPPPCRLPRCRINRLRPRRTIAMQPLAMPPASTLTIALQRARRAVRRRAAHCQAVGGTGWLHVRFVGWVRGRN